MPPNWLNSTAGATSTCFITLATGWWQVRLLYKTEAAAEEDRVDFGGSRLFKTNKKREEQYATADK
ncbi:hypothetical protein NS24R_21700 [Enterobacter hormaechei subsp. xiangfangensis]|nr:hypothetical protein NS24R_21700 [Enterobacter hormaechei subsp. xiangfangensis]